MESLVEREHNALFQTYKRLPIEVDHAEGCYIFDTEGNKYLDFLGGIAVNALGHSHPGIIAAATKQINKFMHVSNYFYQEPQVRLAEKIKEMTGFDRVFFSNSGTEAIEGAIKLARRWGNTHGKSEIISFTGGFHGRTYGALSMMDKPHYKDAMGPFLTGFNILEYNNPAKLKSAVDKNTAAICLEFIQGEGGLVSVTKDFVEMLETLREKYRFLVIADEIQVGVGRTGKFFGFEHFGFIPDIVTMAKGIGGGLPLGAILGREMLAEVWQKGMHGTTYGGNAVACATGLVVLDELESGLMKKVAETGDYLDQQLQSIKEKHGHKVLEVRGKGLMKGLLLSFDASKLVSLLLEKKIITNAASGMVLRLVPPLITGTNEVDELCHAIEESLPSIK